MTHDSSTAPICSFCRWLRQVTTIWDDLLVRVLWSSWSTYKRLRSRVTRMHAHHFLRCASFLRWSTITYISMDSTIQPFDGAVPCQMEWRHRHLHLWNIIPRWLDWRCLWLDCQCKRIIILVVSFSTIVHSLKVHCLFNTSQSSNRFSL